MKNNNNILYYLVAIVIFIVFKFGFTLANNDDLSFLLKPTDTVIGLITGSNSVYFFENGYFHEKLNIYIDKSCAGFNFWILSFLMLSFLGIKNVDNILKKLLVIPMALLGGYLLNIFVNTSRIYASIVIQTQTSFFAEKQSLIHETIGIITNLSFLILVYLVIERILTNRKHDAKLT